MCQYDKRRGACVWCGEITGSVMKLRKRCALASLLQRCTKVKIAEVTIAYDECRFCKGLARRPAERQRAVEMRREVYLQEVMDWSRTE